MIVETKIEENSKPVKRIERGEDERGWRWYEVDGVKLISVTQVLDVIQHFQLSNWFKNNSANKIQKVKDATASFGSSMHKIVEMDLQNDQHGTEKKITIDNPELAKGYENWTKLKNDNHIQSTHTETMVYSLKYGFAGQLDSIGTFKFKNPPNAHRTHAVQDLKTGRFSIKTGWQIAAYRRAAIEMGIADKILAWLAQMSTVTGYKFKRLNMCILISANDSFCMLCRISKVCILMNLQNSSGRT